MDFTPTEAQQEVSSLAARVLSGDRAAGDEAALWKELAEAGLLAVTLPGWLDGDGLGVGAAAALLTEAGRHAAAVPVAATVMTGVLPVIRWGDRALQEKVLAGVGTGATVLTAAVREPSGPLPAAPATTATLTGGGTVSGGTVSGGTVSGVKIGVPYCAEASWVLVPASLAGGGTAVAVIDPAQATVTRTYASGTAPEYTLRMAGTPVAGVLADGAVTGLHELALAGACCLADGALAAALALTTRHLGTRRQFGRPLASFQAAAQQIADVYIAARTLHLATVSACWRLADGRDAGADLDVAAYWLAAYAPAALRTCHHLHGGVGMDVTYPLPRYSALIKDLARFTGGASHRLDQLATRV